MPKIAQLMPATEPRCHRSDQGAAFNRNAWPVQSVYEPDGMAVGYGLMRDRLPCHCDRFGSHMISNGHAM
jgi:hypothetical protein